MTYRHGDYYIPDRMMPGIQRYIEHGQQPGDFLTAVIQNNLKESFGRADDENIKNIMAYVAYFYNEAPRACWGSEEKMRAWIKTKQEERDERERNQASHQEPKDK